MFEIIKDLCYSLSQEYYFILFGFMCLISLTMCLIIVAYYGLTNKSRLKVLLDHKSKFRTYMTFMFMITTFITIILKISESVGG